MNRAACFVAVFAMTLVAMWGCSQGPNSRSALVERIRTLEEKNTRIEDELCGVKTVRDQLRVQLSRAEDHIQKLQLIVKERDELRIQVTARTSERDQILTQYDQFRRSVKDLVGQADQNVLRFPDGEPVTVSIKMPDYQR